jgi:hypothetical protein
VRRLSLQHFSIVVINGQSTRNERITVFLRSGPPKSYLPLKLVAFPCVVIIKKGDKVPVGFLCASHACAICSNAASEIYLKLAHDVAQRSRQ